MWRACKAPSRVQWYPKTATSRAHCFFRFFLPAGHIHEARVSEKQKKSTLITKLHSQKGVDQKYLTYRKVEKFE